MWESKLIDLVDSGFLTERDPVNLLTLLYIIQISWCGIDDARLFELTKLVLTEANTTTLQVANRHPITLWGIVWSWVTVPTVMITDAKMVGITVNILTPATTPINSGRMKQQSFGVQSF